MFEVGGVAAIKAHRWFTKIPWTQLLRKQGNSTADNATAQASSRADLETGVRLLAAAYNMGGHLVRLGMYVCVAVPAPVVPACGDDADTRNFDEEFTKMDLSTSIVELEVRSAATQTPKWSLTGLRRPAAPTVGG